MDESPSRRHRSWRRTITHDCNSCSSSSEIGGEYSRSCSGQILFILAISMVSLFCTFTFDAISQTSISIPYEVVLTAKTRRLNSAETIVATGDKAHLMEEPEHQMSKEAMTFNMNSWKGEIVKSVGLTAVVKNANHGDFNENMNDTLGIVSRSFRRWPTDRPLPCYKPETNWISSNIQNSKCSVGLLYLKLYKTGSSTGSGIHLRISRNVAKRNGYDMCKMRFNHGPDSTPGKTIFHNRSYDNSYLWTIIREPTARAISAFFHFGVSRLGIEPTDENFQSFLQEMYPTRSDYYLHALYTEDVYSNRTLHDPVQVSNSILNEYDFIGITERMDESAVALMMLLNLKLADVLYLNAKVHGGYDGGGGPTGCTIIAPTFVTEKMWDFFQSEFWKDWIQYDSALYKAANKSLDKTIDALGRTKFNENLKSFILAKELASTKCLKTVKFPCDENGHKRQENATDCLWKDSGCGTTCLDDVATEMSLW